jgi:hypothetical protein
MQDKDDTNHFGCVRTLEIASSYEYSQAATVVSAEVGDYFAGAAPTNRGANVNRIQD